ncbi:MAG: hypothetical protein E7295_04605 [Lachnospiraceae bacterium]|jgi:hypothetical protein|nr:hypothetical protein [Lachnospiraceae bacterium]
MASEEKRNAEQILKELWEKEAKANGKCQEDVKFVYESVQKGTFSKRDCLCDELYAFVEKVDSESGKTPALGRNIVMDEENQEADFLLLNQVLTLQNAPLGKWPSKGLNPLWQQVDVNLAIRKGDGSAFEETGKIVAAHEKTEADKTALLEELLVNNVVDRAELLAKYEKPDEAFESFTFYHGEEKNHAYAEYPSKWHMLRNDNINEYSMVLSAQEHGALEKLCKDIKAQEKTAGRLTAPLTSEAERKAFYEKELLPFVEAFRKANLAEDRLPKYKKAREEFLAQLKIVKDMQAKQGVLQQTFLRNWKEEKQASKSLKDAEAAIEHGKRDAENAENGKKPLMEQRDKNHSDLEDLYKQMEKTGAEAQQAKNEWTKYNEIIRTGFDKEQQLRGSVNAMTKLLSKKKYEAVMEQADQCAKEAIEAQEKAPAAEKKMKELTAQYDELATVEKRIQNNLTSINEKLTQLTKTINTARASMAKKEEEKEQAKCHLESVEKDHKAILEQWSKEQGDDQRTMLDLDFVKDLLSKDAKTVAKRTAENPWISKNYQKEREKLFALALELQQAFVAASECCNANLATLSQYLGYWKKGKEKIVFHQADREETAASLWQTLFLFLPLPAVDLESLSELFADARKPGVIGMVALEDADVAAPQKLVGALYRGRRAVTFEKTK